MIDPLLTVPAAKILTEKIFSLLKKLGDDIRQDMGDGLREYVISFQEKFSSIKTFLYFDKLHPFYSVYYPLTISKFGCEIKTLFKDFNPDDLFTERNYLTFIGYAGCGKSMLTRHIFLQAINKSAKIPIFLELRKLNEYPGTLNDYIKEFIFRFELSQNEDIYKHMMSNGDFLFLFDGYDEISFQTKSKRTTEIEDFVDKHHNNYFVITSRPESGIEYMERFDNYKVDPLNRIGIAQFINLQYEVCPTEDNKELFAKATNVLNDENNVHFYYYVNNPLLLSMFLLSYRQYPELPKQKNIFFTNVFNTLYSRHDSQSKPGGYYHEKKTGDVSLIKSILEEFSFISYFQSKYEFSPDYIESLLSEIGKHINHSIVTDDLISDLSSSISIWLKDGVFYTFPHRSMQEYFAASFIQRQTEDVKIKIYSDWFSKGITSSPFLFWDLCRECDEFYFIKFFMLLNMKKLKEKLLCNCTDENRITDALFNFIAIKYKRLKYVKNNLHCDTNWTFESIFLYYCTHKSMRLDY